MKTEIVHTVAALRAATTTWRNQHPTGRIALVPTMGALHDGHLQLFDHALAHADVVIVSIFVNPTQFSPDEDFATYPRTLRTDVAACASRGVRWVFAPNATEMYPEGDDTEVRVPTLAAGLCGLRRPDFFGGVARVVLKLLNIADADVAVFGEKDYQQLQIIRRMARDLHHRTEILGAPTARETDGLAMSSRNRNLSAADRARAPQLHAALLELVGQLSRDGSAAGTAAALATASRRLTAAGARIDYLTIVDAEQLDPVTEIAQPARVALAAWLGETRLIDNLPIFPA